MPQPPSRQDRFVPPLELDRIETGAWREILWSNGHRIRFNSFANFDHRPLDPDQHRLHRRRKRTRKVARRANGTLLKAQLAQHGLSWETLRWSW